jgi:CRISPR-associated protein (TIGR02710 family)
VIVFFASADSRVEIGTRVRPLTAHPWRDQEVIVTPDHQDLTGSMEVLANELPSRLQALGVSTSDVVVDYTGGTKTMSAALVLATINEPVTYSYVGGKVRTKGGLGVVLDGSEAVLKTPNPWDVLAVDSRRRVARQFNSGQFKAAEEIAGEAASRVSERYRALYVGLKDLCEAYRRWHGFDYAKGRGKLNAAAAKLRQYALAADDAGLLEFLDAVEGDLQHAQAIVPVVQAVQGGRSASLADQQPLIVDLVTNAVRTMRLAGRPDDGVARLYGALEKLAKAELGALGIDNSAAEPGQIPEGLREEYVARYLDEGSGRLRFGLHASYQLLAALEAPVGQRYRARERELADVLAIRNMSLMAHGWAPIKGEVFDRLLAITLDFLGLEEADLPRLPHFPDP